MTSTSRRYSHCAAKFVHHGFRTRVGQHALDLLLQNLGLLQLAGGGDVQQLVVGDAAPQKERKARGQLEIADRVNGSGSRARRIALDAIEKLRTDQQAFESPLDAEIEVPFLAAVVVEREQRGDIGIGYGTAISPARQGRKNLLGASRLGRGVRRGGR